MTVTDNKRRNFMKGSALLVSGLALKGSSPEEAEAKSAGSKTELEPRSLGAVARAVLPVTALGEPGVERVLQGFRRWLSELEPVAELDHAYIATDEILYGPPDPAPLWSAQLDALSLESEKRFGVAFVDLPPEERDGLLRRHLPKDLPAELPQPAEAPHVALGLLAYFYQTSEANDLAYQAAIQENTCRGLESGAREPSSRRS